MRNYVLNIEYKGTDILNTQYTLQTPEMIIFIYFYKT